MLSLRGCVKYYIFTLGQGQGERGQVKVLQLITVYRRGGGVEVLHYFNGVRELVIVD